MPYDQNRVKLAAGDKDNRNGYINASHVSATVGNQQRFYIAGQGPLPHTVPHFWQASTYRVSYMVYKSRFVLLVKDLSAL